MIAVELTIAFFVGAALLTLFWCGAAWTLVTLFELKNPLGRFVIFLAPLLAAFLSRLRLSPDMKVEILVICVSVASLLIGRDIYRYVRFRIGVLREASVDARAQAECRRVAQQLKLTRIPVVFTTGRLRSGPVVLGLLKPVIVFPEFVLKQLSGEELRVLLAHELAHIRRYDMLWKWGLLYLRRLAFWNPVAAWPYRWLALEMERACDRVVCRLTGKPGTLARALCKVEGLVAAQDSAVLPEAVPRLDSELHARIGYLSQPMSYHWEWRSLLKTLAILALFHTICFRPAEYFLTLLHG